MRPRTLLMSCLLLAACVMSWADYRNCPPMSSGSHIRPENRYFDVFPRIVPADKETAVELIPLFDHVRPKADCKYEVEYVPTESWAEKSGWTKGAKTPLVPENGVYSFKMFFENEQEHVLYVEEIRPDGKKKLLGDFRVYSLKEDLFALRPYKGDFHMHSNRSDGVESPAYVAGACRRVGLDFMALSDHKTYSGSVEAQEAFKGLPIDLRIYNAEEVHSPDNPVHILSFGATSGITELYKDDESAYRKEVAEIQAKLGELPPGVDAFSYAASVWVFNKIRERGGMAMYCHPYWFTGHRYYISEALTSYLLETKPFDALELISGMGRDTLTQVDTNALQVARYHEERAKGRQIPICGISDTHGVENSDAFGRYYTVCFAPSSDLADLIAAIKGLNSVAVEAIGGELPRAYGPFRLVRYTHFLLHEVFPQHDERCFEEGRQMILYASGDPEAVQRLALLQGQVLRLYNRYWGQR